MTEPTQRATSRARPVYEPRRIECRNCGAGLKLSDDRTRQMVCQYCGARLELDAHEWKVLDVSKDTTVPFRFALGATFNYQGANYEIIARVALIEDDDIRYMSHQYYLYHPQRGALWLDEYQGDFSLSWTTRVMPVATDQMPNSNPITSRVWRLQTYDGLSWRSTGFGVYQVHYVDGALPYTLRVGEEFAYAEYVGIKDDEQQYEVQQGARGEIEFGRGHVMSYEALEKATGQRLSNARLTPRQQRRHRHWGYVAIAFLCLLFLEQCAVGAMASMAERKILDEVVSGPQLTQEVMSSSFGVDNNDEPIKIQISANLSNAWMSVNAAIVREETTAFGPTADTVIHVFDEDLSFYSGVETGRDYEGSWRESWSEGSPAAKETFTIPDAGRYRILLGAVSGQGLQETATNATQNLRIRVFDQVYPTGWTSTGCGFLMVFGIILLFTLSARSRTSLWLMRFIRAGLLVTALGMVTLTTVGTYARWGAYGDEVDHPDGISIRQTSAPGYHGPRFFPIYYSSRRHLGGGIAGGK